MSTKHDEIVEQLADLFQCHDASPQDVIDALWDAWRIAIEDRKQEGESAIARVIGRP
jgi:hypothetical protein